MGDDIGQVGAAQIGTVLTLRGAVTAELFADAFDFIWIDLEHAALSHGDMQDMILGAQAASTAAFVRLPRDAYASMTVALDAGADGIVLADVPDARSVALVLDRVSHPPQGTRGWGPRRSSLRRRHDVTLPTEPQIWAQIESPAAVAAADEIAGCPGLGALIVGTADLTLTLGIPQRFGADELRDAIREIQRAATRAGKRFGVAGPLTTMPSGLLDGAHYLCHSTDARMAAVAADDAAAQLRNRTR